jgi:hypothetical protein
MTKFNAIAHGSTPGGPAAVAGTGDYGAVSRPQLCPAGAVTIV